MKRKLDESNAYVLLEELEESSNTDCACPVTYKSVSTVYGKNVILAYVPLEMSLELSSPP